MSDAMYGFATGFAQGFSQTYTARIQNEAEEKQDKIRFGAQAWLRLEERYNSAKAADEALMSQAQALVDSESIIPKDAVINIYNMLKSGRSEDNIRADVRSSGAKFEALPKPSDSGLNIDNSSLSTELGDQTEAMLGENNTGLSAGANTPSLSVPNADGKAKYDTSTASKNDPFAQYAKEIQETVGSDADYFTQVMGGYKAPSRVATMKFTPGGTKAENLSFEKQAILAAKADPRWSEEDYAGNIDLLAEYKAKLSPDTTKPRTFETPKELALFNLMQSAEYKALEDDPTTQNNLLRELESSFSKNGASTTYTAGNYASEHSKYSLMLASDNPEEITEAQNWFINVKPVREEALKSVAALTKDPEEPETLALMYVNAEGKNRMGTGIASENGTYTLSDGTVVEKDQILNATTVDMADARTKAVQAASGVYKKVSDTKIAASVAAQNLMRLDRMAFDNENVLKTVAGGGSSAVSSFSKEMQGLVGLLGELQKQDPTQSSTSLLAGVNAEVDTMFADNIITDEVARAYKEFNAAIVRTIFATGKALGQQGNGFSNQDYQVISESLVNANSYEAFSNNLRRLTNELYETWDATAVDARGTGLVQNVLMMPGGFEIIGGSLMGVEEYYQSDAGKSQANVYEWSKGKAKPRANGRLIETASQDDVTRGMPEAFLGEKVIMFIETGPDGKATGTVRYERY